MTRELVLLLLLAPALARAGEATTPAALARDYAAQAGSGFVASTARGRAFYTATHASKGCISCHGADPKRPGQSSAGKAIEPLAPAANPRRFTDRAKVEKWFRRNCGDVLGRECTAAERADFLAFLLGAATTATP